MYVLASKHLQDALCFFFYYYYYHYYYYYLYYGELCVLLLFMCVVETHKFPFLCNYYLVDVLQSDPSINA